MSASTIPARGTTYKSTQHPGETLRITKIVPAALSEYDRIEIHARTETRAWELQPVVFEHMVRAEGWEASE